YTFVSTQIEMVPQNYQPLSEEQGVQMQKLIDAMEDDDDVQNVWHNWEE
ncbi:MAG: YebC/PmpR family DNA-binding transcriptional regulator, partial [Oscillospiraceae bacterium]|nr:YebC/PmpR family DNA-binding transcriptional regulator [Oscillospiraceae bacterium]